MVVKNQNLYFAVSIDKFSEVPFVKAHEYICKK